MQAPVLRIARPAFVLLAAIGLVSLPLPAASTAFMGAVEKFLHKDVDVITVTDMTRAGKAWAPATVEHPVRYQIIHLGAASFGDNWAGEAIPSNNAVLLWMMAAMRDQGYLLADATHPPELTLVFGWGMFRESTGEPTLEPPSHFLDGAVAPYGVLGSRRRALRFLGGEKVDLMWEQQQYGGFIDPRVLLRGMARTGVTGKVWDFAASDLFLGLVRAYPARLMSTPRDALLWETRFACPATGLRMDRALPQMILAAAPNLGRETAKPVNVNATATYGSKVNFGDFTILNDDVELAAAKANRARVGKSDGN